MRHIRWFCILILLLQAGCEGCKQATGDHVDSSYGATVKSGGSVCELGSLNYDQYKSLMTVPVEVEKYVPGNKRGILGVAFIPEGESTDKVFEEIQACAVGTDSFHIILPRAGGYAFYNCTLNEEVSAKNPKKYAVHVSSLKGELPPNTYQVVPFIKASGVAKSPVFHPQQGVDHVVRSSEEGPKVTLDEGSIQTQAKKSSSGDERHILSMSGRVVGLKMASRVGFLFIPQGAGLTSVDVIEKVLFDPNFPDRSGSFNKLVQQGNEGVVFFRCSDHNANGLFSMTNEEDTTGALQKGKTYDVHALVVHGNHFTVSKQKGEVSISQVEVELTMNKIKPGHTSLIAKYLPANHGDNRDFEIHEYAQVLSGTITKQKRTTNPFSGFVFAPQSKTREEVKTAVENGIPTSANAWELHDECIVCTAKTTGVARDNSVNTNCDFITNLDKAPQLGQTYNVYCWVYDNAGQGTVFLSEAEELKLFRATGGITLGAAHSIDRSANRMTIKDVKTQLEVANATDPEMTIAFIENPTQLNEQYLSQSREAYKKVKDPEESRHNRDNKNWLQIHSTYEFLNSRVWMAGNNSLTSHEINATNGTQLKEETTYTLHLVVRNEDMIYGIPGTMQITTGPMATDNSVPVYSVPDNFENSADFNGKQVSLYMNSKKASVTEMDGRHIEALEPNQDRDKKLIRAALSHHYSGDPLIQAYRKFNVLNQGEVLSNGNSP